MHSYITKSYLLHDGRAYRVGSTVSLFEDDAAPLLAGGHIVPAAAVETVVIVPGPAVAGATLEKFTLPELTTYASGLSLTIPTSATKADILALIASAATTAETVALAGS